MRDAIGKYYADKRQVPGVAEALATDKYLRKRAARPGHRQRDHLDRGRAGGPAEGRRLRREERRAGQGARRQRILNLVTRRGARWVIDASFFKTAAAAGLALAGSGAHATRRMATDDFISTVQRARIFDLSHTWDENSPIAGVNPPYSMALNATHARSTRGTFGDGGQLSFTSEVQHWSGQHGAPSIDAIGHIGHNGMLFGGVDAAAATSDPRGIGRGKRRRRASRHRALSRRSCWSTAACCSTWRASCKRNSEPLPAGVRHHRRAPRRDRATARACASSAATRC